MTRSGAQCQDWASQSPHRHSNTPELRPAGGLEGNFCRNPDGEPSIWCYTSNRDSRWEFCDPKKNTANFVFTKAKGRCRLPNGSSRPSDRYNAGQQTSEAGCRAKCEADNRCTAFHYWWGRHTGACWIWTAADYGANNENSQVDCFVRTQVTAAQKACKTDTCSGTEFLSKTGKCLSCPAGYIQDPQNPKDCLYGDQVK